MTLSAPLRVTWDLTTTCNLSCRYCYNSSHSKRRGLSPQDLHVVAEKLANSPIFFMTLSGGEPLVEPEIWNIIQILKKEKKTVVLATNGTLITRKVARRIKDFNVDSVQISLDGLKETHDYLRGVKGCFKKTLEGIGHCVTENIPVTVSTVVSKANVGEIQQLLEILIRLGVGGFRANRLVLMGRGEPLENEVLTREQTRLLTLHMLEQRKKLESTIEILLDECISFLGEGIREYGLSWSGCPAGQSECAVDSKGDVYPCVFLTCEEFRMGNLLKSEFDNIWRSEGFEDFRAIERTCDCEIADFCRGGCPAAAYGQYGDITRKDPYCWRNNHE